LSEYSIDLNVYGYIGTMLERKMISGADKNHYDEENGEKHLPDALKAMEVFKMRFFLYPSFYDLDYFKSFFYVSIISN